MTWKKNSLSTTSSRSSIRDTNINIGEEKETRNMWFEGYRKLNADERKKYKIVITDNELELDQNDLSF